MFENFYALTQSNEILYENGFLTISFLRNATLNYPKDNNLIKKPIGNLVDIEKEYLAKTNQQNKLELNQRLISFFNTQANNKFIKSCKNELGGFRLPPDYKKQQLGLTDYLLKIDN